MNVIDRVKQEWFLLTNRFDITIGRIYEDEKDNDIQFYTCYTVNLTPWRRVVARLLGRCRVGDIKLNGWSSELPLYAFHCKKHGYQLDYPHGYNGRLDCPECWVEI